MRTPSSVPLIWVDGQLVPEESATLHVLSHAVQRGSTVFDVLRVVETSDGVAAFGLREHVSRFERSMRIMGMTPEPTIDRLEAVVADVVSANPGANTVKLVAAWASCPTGTIPESPVPQISVAAVVGNQTPPTEVAPVRVRTATAPKMPPDVLPSGLKVAAAYTYSLRHTMLARQDGFDEVILRTPQGELAEGVSQSLFVVADGQIVLPPLDVVLDGITRRAIIDLAHHEGLHTQVRPVAWPEVEAAEELFLCSTTNPVWPLASLDERELPTERPVTSLMAHAVEELLAGRHPLSGRWLTTLHPTTHSAADQPG